MTPLREGMQLPPRARTVERDDLVAYAEASGDRNPLHQDDAFARSVGFPGVIAHGMLTMGHLASSVSEWAGAGAELRSMRAQFRSAVLLGDTIVAGGRVRSLAGNRAELELWITVDRDGQTEHPIKRAEAVVLLREGAGDAGT